MLPKLLAAGWADEQIHEQLIFTAGHIVVADRQARRAKPKRADYMLSSQRDYRLAVVEAKANYRQPTNGMQQAKDYARRWGCTSPTPPTASASQIAINHAVEAILQGSAACC